MDLTGVPSSYLHYGDVHSLYRPEQRLGRFWLSRDAGGTGMSERHQRPVRWTWLASVLAVVALGLGFATVPAATVPAAAAPSRPAAPMVPLPLDAGAIVT